MQNVHFIIVDNRIVVEIHEHFARYSYGLSNCPNFVENVMLKQIGIDVEKCFTVYVDNKPICGRIKV